MLTPALIAFLSTVPGCTFLTHDYGDSTLVIQTMCEPICSSCARIYNKEGEVIRAIEPPYRDAIFPEATLSYPDGDSTLAPVIIWTDNTPLLLDDEEKKQP